MPMAGHLVHMPAHIYERVGDYSSAAKSNLDAAAADEAYFKATGVHGVYSMYYAHNLDFLAIANSMQGRYRDAIDASNKLVDFTRPMVKDMPMFEPVLAKSLLMWERFHKWDEIMKQPAARCFAAVNPRRLAFCARDGVCLARRHRQRGN